MTVFTAFGCEKFGAQIRFFLACLYCQKQLKTYISVKFDIILILKSVLKERCA